MLTYILMLTHIQRFILNVVGKAHGWLRLQFNSLFSFCCIHCRYLVKTLTPAFLVCVESSPFCRNYLRGRKVHQVKWLSQAAEPGHLDLLPDPPLPGLQHTWISWNTPRIQHFLSVTLETVLPHIVGGEELLTSRGCSLSDQSAEPQLVFILLCWYRTLLWSWHP